MMRWSPPWSVAPSAMGRLRSRRSGDASTAMVPPSKAPYRDLSSNALYRQRILLLFSLWFIGYFTVYSYASGFTHVVTAPGYPLLDAGVIAAVGTIGFLVEAIILLFPVENLERRYWLHLAAVITLVGAVIVAVAGVQIVVAFIGFFLIFTGFNPWVSPPYAMTAESFRMPASPPGFVVVAPLLAHLSILGALILISVVLVVAAVMAQSTSTRAIVHWTASRPERLKSPCRFGKGTLLAGRIGGSGLLEERLVHRLP